MAYAGRQTRKVWRVESSDEDKNKLALERDQLIARHREDVGRLVWNMMYNMSDDESITITQREEVC